MNDATRDVQNVRTTWKPQTLAEAGIATRLAIALKSAYDHFVRPSVVNAILGDALASETFSDTLALAIQQHLHLDAVPSAKIIDAIVADVHALTGDRTT